MKEDEIRYFEPERLKKAVDRLKYIEAWIDDMFVPNKKEKESKDKYTKRGLLSKILSIFRR